MAQQSSNGNRPKLSEKGLLTPDNCVVALIDHQGQMLFGTSNFDRQGIINNTVAFGKAARVFDVPVVLTTVETKSFSGNMWPQLRAVFPGQEPIERSSMNSWDDKNFVAAIEKTGRKKILIAGLWTETCVALPTVQALHDGYEIYVVEDCCGDVSNPGRSKTRDVTFHHVGVAARLGQQGHLRCGNGHREEPLRSLRDRRRVRVHDGARRAGHEISRVRGPRCSRSSQVKLNGRRRLRPS